MRQSIEKGSALEMAVRAIEAAILRDAPGYSEKTFTIESRRIIKAEGVRHEIDVWVKVEVAPGYEAFFIFECKNWQDKVSKNEIIVFSEKIKVAGAQKGFFVAKSFTSDAEAQARTDPRISLLRVTDLPAESVPLLPGLHGINVERISSSVNFFEVGRSSEPKIAPVSQDEAVFCLHGEVTPLKEWLSAWFDEESNRLTDRHPSEFADESPHELSFKGTRQFAEGEATLDGKAVDVIELDGTIRVDVTKPRFMSYYEVDTRGRAVTFLLDIGGTEITGAFVMRGDKPSGAT